MKILLVHNRYKQAGGEDSVFAAESELLKQHGHHVIEYVDDNHRIDRMNPLGLALKTIWSQDSYRKISKLLQAERPDVAHFHNTFALISPSAFYACRSSGVPVVQTLHNYRLVCPGAQLYRNGRVCQECMSHKFQWPGVLHACYHNSHAQTAVLAAMTGLHHAMSTWQRQVDVYIALNDFYRQALIRMGLPPNKVVVKPNCPTVDPGMRESAGDYVLFVGRLTREKGLDTLLEAWRSLPAIPLKIAGDGPFMSDVRLAVERNSLHHVTILGRQSPQQVVSLLKGARFLVLPSRTYENFPMTIAEAFACGVPVLAARHGAMIEIVEQNRTGWFFGPGDSDDLVRAASAAWADRDEAIAMGMAARQEYETKYHATHNYRILMEIYENAISRRRNLGPQGG